MPLEPAKADSTRSLIRIKVDKQHCYGLFVSQIATSSSATRNHQQRVEEKAANTKADKTTASGVRAQDLAWGGAMVKQIVSAFLEVWDTKFRRATRLSVVQTN